jgi:hypothetical protein
MHVASTSAKENETDSSLNLPEESSTANTLMLA